MGVFEGLLQGEPEVIDGRVVVLCVADYFLPGFKAGGPIRTIANMEHALADRVLFRIFTRDRDLGDAAQYPGIISNRWIAVDARNVYYASPSTFGPLGLFRAMKEQAHDAVYLNSFFSFRGSISLLLGLRLFGRSVPVILAPRGEFSRAALRLKRFRKQLYISVSRFLGLYRKCIWHASSQAEASDVLRQFPGAVVRVAGDPVTLDFVKNAEAFRPDLPSEGLRLVFVSRISPMKNLRFLIQALAAVEAQVSLDIYGPLEDHTYWSECLNLSPSLPKNISVRYKGVIDPDLVSGVVSRYDLFVLPTLGENFGHVIFEALRSGTPVLISDRTPWQPDAAGAVVALGLDDMRAWSAHLQEAANRKSADTDDLRQRARSYAEHYVRTNDTSRQNWEIFASIIPHHHRPNARSLEKESEA